ncbi:PepSY-associated TM helix domain-containing protein [Cohnella cholangitidis]|uniref:PepSY domain-containing protein n=1 Tax=Cohnella cholangitidis TaxID=2598458 RepID=A0A7G5BYI9_9BACL|nr:PepSY-associated TM helix domain-containing protein [Cohnella cholangitidis]QMV42023.1 PepSY domain-containing protein [Cohnella cholangitidis]
MKKTRTLHLWIGLICSVFILLQSITGLLLLNESWFTGGRDGGGPPGFARMEQSQSYNSGDAGAESIGEPNDPQGRMPMGQGGEGSNSGIAFIKNLHKGQIGGTDITILLDITAIGMIVLTLTGIALSIKTLRAQSKSRQKRRQAENAA